MKTVTTPPIDFDNSVDPGISVGSFTAETDDVLWVRSGLEDVPFSFVGTDAEGRKVDFSTGVIWVSSTFAQDPGNLQKVVDAYAAADPSRRTAHYTLKKVG